MPELESKPIEEVLDYIISTHHSYVKTKLPIISSLSENVNNKHKDKHPELTPLMENVSMLNNDLLMHMMKEERMLFPYIYQLAAVENKKNNYESAPFGTVQNPIHAMEAEHETALKVMAEIRLQTKGYNAPDDADDDFRLYYTELAAFEKDLLQHIYIENNILHPRAIELEQKLNNDLNN